MIQTLAVFLTLNSHRYSECPCELNCLDGCDDCDNPVCNCQVRTLVYGPFSFSETLTVGIKINIVNKVVEENPDWNRCIDDNSLKLGRCVHACNDNKECEDDCLSRFKTRQLNCPCEVSCGCLKWNKFQIQENCSAGCPCSEYDCIETTSAPEVTTATVPPTTTSPTGNAVLVLSTKNSNNKPFIVDFNGN